MQVFGVCQLSELKGARRGSPDNQAAIRVAAVGSWRHRWQKNAVRSRRPHRLRSKRSPTCRSRSGRSRSTVATSSRTNSSKLGRPRGKPPVRTAAPTGRRSRRPRALLWIMRYESYACYELPRSSKPLIQYSKSLQHLYNQYRPHGALAGQTPASYLKEAEPKRPARLILLIPDKGLT
jgi:hypothetical protein